MSRPLHVSKVGGWWGWRCHLCLDLSPTVSRNAGQAADHARAHLGLWHTNLPRSN